MAREQRERKHSFSVSNASKARRKVEEKGYMFYGSRREARIGLISQLSDLALPDSQSARFSSPRAILRFAFSFLPPTDVLVSSSVAGNMD